jgi:hypothetical protein
MVSPAGMTTLPVTVPMVAERTLAGNSPASVLRALIHGPISRDRMPPPVGGRPRRCEDDDDRTAGWEGWGAERRPVGYLLDHQAGDIVPPWDEVVACLPTVLVHPGRDYWRRQWADINPMVTPTAIANEADGRVRVTVDSVVRDRAGRVLSHGTVAHLYRFEDGLVRDMEIEVSA